MDFDTPRLLELLRNPAEDLSFEIKEWLDLGNNAHKAKLAQAIIALANHGGGLLLLGYAQQPDGTFIPAEPRPANLSGYIADIVNDISRSYLNPPVHCQVRHVAHPLHYQATCFRSSMCSEDIRSRSWRGEEARKVKAAYRSDGFTSGELVHHRRSPNRPKNGERCLIVAFEPDGRNSSIAFD
jgi:hypothetical protein